ncbi:MAG TPA: phospholipase [Anaerolineae bacterium]|nr:phospholipase [Anaerolineae bacterium]HIP69951.1 phospholipase [Anaerolineae bacterium]
MGDKFVGPHQGQPVMMAGLPLAEAQAAMIMVHGRGATAVSILSLAAELNVPGFAYLAPQAAGNTWYPYSFLAPIADNEPGISSGMQVLADLIEQIVAAGIPADKIMLLGFSQGACLAVEFVARHARRYGGTAVLSGGLIGPDEISRAYAGSLAGTPIFLGCSDVDFHIPKERVIFSAELLAEMGADVTTRLYPDMGHTVNENELIFVRQLMQTLIQ